MGKSKDTKDPFPIGRDKIGEFRPHVRLNIQEIRARADQLKGLPDGAELPNWSDLSYSDRIAVVMRLIPGEQREELLGRSGKQLARYASGGEPPFPVVAALAIETEIPLDWIATGLPPRKVPDDDVAQNFALVPQYNVKASAGGGAVAPFEDLGAAGFVAFRTEWLRRAGVNPKYAQTLFASGDSMEPTIRDGDMLLLDRSIDHVVDNGIYVVVLGGLILVKRVQTRRDGSLVLKSDNGHYDDEVVPPDEIASLKVEGRVRWVARTI